jgi:hypothetical protein
MNPLRLCVLCVLLSCSAAAQSLFPVRDEGEGPDRAFDVLHYRIEVGFDESKKLVSGTTTVTLVPFIPVLSTVELDAEKLNVASVMLGSRPVKFDVGARKLLITLDRDYTTRDTLALAIRYSCTPSRGLYFVQPDSGYPEKPWQIWSQGEDMDNHFWFPCHDFPNDFATSEMIVTVKSSYRALSNGRLVSVKEVEKNDNVSLEAGHPPRLLPDHARGGGICGAEGQGGRRPARILGVSPAYRRRQGLFCPDARHGPLVRRDQRVSLSLGEIRAGSHQGFCRRRDGKYERDFSRR